jgi:hypothetical protein
MKLCFQPYIERPKPTLYATWASKLGSNLNFFWPPPWGLELNQPWTSFLSWKTLLDSIFSNPCTTHGHKHGCHVLISLSDFSRPWNRNTQKTQPARKKNPTQSLARQHPKRPRTDQQQHNPNTYGSRNSLKAHTGQTGQEHRSNRSRLGSSG